jgi:hypothetical protein
MRNASELPPLAASASEKELYSVLGANVRDADPLRTFEPSRYGSRHANSFRRDCPSVPNLVR